MSDFDDRIRVSADQIRQRAAEIAAGDHSTLDATTTTNSPRAGQLRRWTLIAASIVLAAAGVASLLAVGRSETTNTTTPTGSLLATTPLPTSPSTATTPPPAPTTRQPTTTVDTSSTRIAPSTTGVPDRGAGVSRPVVDPAVCDSFAAIQGAPSGLPRNPGNLPLTLFTRPSSLPIPIQVIAAPDDGYGEPFAIVQRYYALHERSPDPVGNVTINGNDVQLRTFDNGNGEAIWNLPDGTQGYLRSRGLDDTELIDIIAALQPRPTDTAIPGFDYPDDTATGRQLIAESMNTDVEIDNSAGSQCRVPSTSNIYRIWTVSGGLLYQYASILDRPAPLEVGVINGAPVIISGPADPTAPTIDEIVLADEDQWQQLLDTPQATETPAIQPIGIDTDAIIELPVAARAGPNGYLNVSLSVTDGATTLQIDTADAVLDPAAEFWKIEINGSLRSRTTASSGGLLGIRLHDSAATEPFTVEISLTDGDDFTIQTTGPTELIPQAPPS